MKKIFLYSISVLLIVLLLIKILSLIDLFLVNKYELQLEGFSDKTSIEEAKELIPQLEIQKTTIQIHIVIIFILIVLYNFILLKLFQKKSKK